MSWHTKTFEELFTFQKKSKRKASAGKVAGDYAFYTSSPTLSKYTNEPDYNKSSLVFGTGGNASVHLTSENFSTSGDCLVATPKNLDELCLKFAFYFFVGNIRVLEEGFKGAGLKHISKAYISKIEIPLPPLFVQKQIAAVLEKADTLRCQCQQMEQELNTLVQSMFLELFGDPVSNPNNWVTKKLKDIVSIQSGATPSKGNDDFWKGNFPWVSPKDMKATYISNSIDHISESAFKETNLKRISRDTILIVVRGMILVHTVPLAITIKDISINQDIKAMKVLDDSIEPLYLLWCLKSQHDHILSKVSTAAHGTKRLDMPDLVGLDICVPPIGIQGRFVEMIKKLDEQLTLARASVSDHESIFHSLMQRAFKGELDLKDMA